MAKKQDNDKELSDILKDQSLFKNVLQKIQYQNDESFDRSSELDILSSEIDRVVNDEIVQTSKYTGDDISTFIYKTVIDERRSLTNTAKNIDQIFSSGKNENLASMMFQNQSNRNVLLEDLDIISSYVYQLKEAVYSVRDAIITADDLSAQISRNIVFDESSSDSKEITGLLKAIEKMEKDLKISHKIKNHIIPKTLKLGSYYVYTVPYSKLFADFEQKKGKSLKTISLESVTENDLEFYKKYKDATDDIKAAKSTYSEFTNDILVCNESHTILDDLMTDSEIHAYMEASNNVSYSDLSDSDFNKKASNVVKGLKGHASSEMVIDQQSDYTNVTGCYVKIIDPRRVVEIKIMDKVLGYYYLVNNGTKATKTQFTNSVRFKNDMMSAINKNDLEADFIEKLASKIAKSTNKKFLEENGKFKDLIINALMYEDMYKKKVRFQFIPVDYMTKFTIDEDENEEGTSMLVDALFPAKLYLYLRIFKVLTMLSKSDDVRVHYIRSSGIDKDTANSTQVVARKMKENQMNFSDLLNYGTAIGKIGKSKDMFVPTGEANERGIETDILSGQDVNFNNDFDESLITDAISATGVPSVIMSYINEADYSRTLVMANAKFIGRVINYQLDFNRGLTELYIKLMRYYLNVKDEDIRSFQYVLAPPRSQNNINMSDILNNADQIANYIVRVNIGENKNPSEEESILKDFYYKQVMREYTSMINWNKMDNMLEAARLESKKYLAVLDNDPNKE